MEYDHDDDDDEYYFDDDDDKEEEATTSTTNNKYNNMSNPAIMIISSNLASLFFSLISSFDLFFFFRSTPNSKQQLIIDNNNNDYYDDTAANESSSKMVAPGHSSSSTSSSSSLLMLGGRIGMGILAAAYVCMLLFVIMVVSAVLGVGLVKMFVLEEPIHITHTLHFDYTHPHPSALFSFHDHHSSSSSSSNSSPVPVGHTLYVSLLLLMPESDYNRNLGIFQLTAELLSSSSSTTTGEGQDDDDAFIVVTKSSHPCMLRFSSWPVRLVRTFMMGVPLLLGITSETQLLTFPIINHKEVRYPRTQAIRVTLIPRAGTSYLPQFYDANILVKSRLPWMKGLVYRWKWTFYVWTTLYMFIMLVMLLLVFLKPLLFPVMAAAPPRPADHAYPGGVVLDELESSPLGGQDVAVREEEESEVIMSETLRRWQKSRSRRKAALLHGASEFDGGSSVASSITLDRGPSFLEGSGDSESVCFQGFDG